MTTTKSRSGTPQRYCKPERITQSEARRVAESRNTYLTADPELRYTNGGTAVCEVTIAHNKRWKTESGEQKEKVSYIGCVIWGRRAEVFAEHHRKGSKALVRGELTQESWEDKTTGKKQSKTKVNVEEFEFVGGRTEQAAAPRPATQQAPKQPAPATGEPEEDDVPF